MLMACTAIELADALDAMKHHRHNTAALSRLDEATLAFGRKSDELREAQRLFSDARHTHRDSYAAGSYSDDAWQQAMHAAQHLATLLRALGNARIARCMKPAEWGTCNLPLAEDGECHSTLGHTDNSHEPSTS